MSDVEPCPFAPKRKGGSRGPDSNKLDLIPEPVRSRVIEICEATTRVNAGLDAEPCVARNHACYRCQDLARVSALEPSP